MLKSDPLIQALPLLRPRVPRLLLAVLCGVLSLGSALALAGVSAWLITRAWQMPPILDLSVAVVAVRALGISRGVLHYCERLASHDTALRAAGSARRQIYRRLADGPIEVTARLHEGELVGRVGSDVDDLSDVLVRAVLPICVAAVLGVGAVTVIALIAPMAGALLALCLLVAGVLAPWLSARSAAAEERLSRVHHSGRDVAAMLALEHAAELRVSGTLADVIAESARRQQDWSHAQDRAARPAALAAAVPTAAMGVSVLGAAIAGIGIASATSPMTLAILMLLPLSSFEAATALPAAATQLTRSRIAARRLLDLTRAPKAVAHQAHRSSGEHTLAARATAGFSADGRRVDLDVELPPGTRMLLTGPSGAGKTTVLLTLAGLIPPRSGTVLLGGQPLASYGELELRSTVAFFAEDAHIFDTTVRDNLLVVRGDCSDQELIDAVDAVGLGPWLRALPDGLGTVLTGGAGALSAGQRRRMLLARVVLCRAPVLLLDEPTEHLDAGDADTVLRELLRPDGHLLPAGSTVVVATHHPTDEFAEDLGCRHRQIAYGPGLAGTLAAAGRPHQPHQECEP